MIEIIGNSCYPYDGVYLRTITFNLINSAKDQQNNVIPIIQLSGGRGSQITVNPRFVTSVTVDSKSAKSPLTFNTPLCDDDDASEDISYMPIHKSNDMSGLYNVGVTPTMIRWNGTRCLKTGDLSKSVYNNCQCASLPRGYFSDYLPYNDGVRFVWFKQLDVCTDAFLYNDPFSKGPITYNPNTGKFGDNERGGFRQLGLKPGETLDSICLLTEYYWMVAITNATKTKTSYYRVGPYGGGYNGDQSQGLGANDLMYTINAGWASGGINVNKMIRHGNKIYHFNEFSNYGIDKPSAVRILDVTKGGFYGVEISGHKTGYNNNGPNNSAVVWPTNLFSTKHGLLASSGFIAKMVDYRFEGPKIKLDSIILSNPNQLQLVDGNTMSVSKK